MQAPADVCVEHAVWQLFVAGLYQQDFVAMHCASEGSRLQARSHDVLDGLYWHDGSTWHAALVTLTYFTEHCIPHVW